MKLERTLAQYANCTESGVAGGSKAQMMYFVEDAKKDIATLASALAAKDAEIARLREAMKLIAEGYFVEARDDRFVVIENPKYSPDDGSDPFIVIEALDNSDD